MNTSALTAILLISVFGASAVILFFYVWCCCCSKYDNTKPRPQDDDPLNMRDTEGRVLYVQEGAEQPQHHTAVVVQADYPEALPCHEPVGGAANGGYYDVEGHHYNNSRRAVLGGQVMERQLSSSEPYGAATYVPRYDA
ncbi:hypothetical protein AGDE_17126 [Angomonas deanei]|nr:hypothetical protein AGDE_17126 [Angomonas deanei]|eukprot:EPY15424.1 hypothetical protein AGDE_17126 [Angomonas deanei]